MPEVIQETDQDLPEISGDELAIAVFSAETQDGEPFYCYIRLTLEKLTQYFNDIGAGNQVDFTALGEILTKGWGEMPSEEVHREMEEKYGAIERERK